MTTAFTRPNYCSFCGGTLVRDSTRYLPKVNIFTGQEVLRIACEKWNKTLGPHDKWEQDAFEEDDRWIRYK